MSEYTQHQSPWEIQLESAQDRCGKLRQVHPEWSFYPDTQRIKSSRFETISTPLDMVEEAWTAWEVASDTFSHPLVQVRAIVPLIDQEALLERTGELTDGVNVDRATARIAGRIPFQLDDDQYGLYYLQIECTDRPAYRTESSVDHNAAVQRGVDKRRKYTPRSLPPGFRTHAVEFVHDQAYDIICRTPLDIDREELAGSIAELHRMAFAYAHDPSQQTGEGAMAILDQNPVLVAFDNAHQLASVGYLERDARFQFGNIALVEPTYFTHPGDAYRRHGLSSHLRQLTQELAHSSNRITLYGGSPTIVFNESIRDTSFPLCLANDCRLAATNEMSISGNLGDAYTAIGPANPDIGYMPMGLTYYADPRIEAIPDDQFIL